MGKFMNCVINALIIFWFLFKLLFLNFLKENPTMRRWWAAKGLGRRKMRLVQVISFLGLAKYFWKFSLLIGFNGGLGFELSRS